MNSQQRNQARTRARNLGRTWAANITTADDDVAETYFNLLQLLEGLEKEDQVRRANTLASMTAHGLEFIHQTAGGLVDRAAGLLDLDYFEVLNRFPRRDDRLQLGFINWAATVPKEAVQDITAWLQDQLAVAVQRHLTWKLGADTILIAERVEVIQEHPMAGFIIRLPEKPTPGKNKS